MEETGTVTATATGLNQCDWPECGRTFKSPAALQMHIGRTHKKTIMVPRQLPPGEARQRKLARQARYRAENIRKGLTTSGNLRKRYPSESPEAKHKSYLKQKARFRAMGLNPHGQPFRRVTAKGLKNIRKAQKLRRQREMLNGVTPEAETKTDNIGESARAIILTAQVLRSVSVGLKI